MEKRSHRETTRSFDEAVRLLHDRINLERLQSFAPQDMEGRLDTLQHVLTLLGNPETTYRTVHVTGTKGKGSTCVMLESILLKSGNRVGRFSSPHLYSFTERLMVDEIACSPDEFTELFFSVYEQIEPDMFQSFTYFELLTLLAFIYFAQKKVDVAVFEVGLGGRLDATNVCNPNVSVITSISLEHTAQLGSTLSDIAREKSGIIKSGVPVVTTVLDREPQNVIRERARSLSSPLFVFNEHFFVRQDGASPYTFQYEARLSNFAAEGTLHNISLKMPGTHQMENAAAAVSAFLLLEAKSISEAGSRTQWSDRINSSSNPVTSLRSVPGFHSAIHAGLRNAFIPLRCEVMTNEELPTFIFDGAHNRSSMRAFIKTVAEMFPNRRLLLIFGASFGKDAEGMFAEIGNRFHHVFLTQSSDSSRRFPPQELRSILALPEANVSVLNDCKDAWERCVQMAEKEDVICITGSLYLAAELRKLILPRIQSGGKF